MAEAAADVVQPGAVGQQPGGQGVTGLMGDAANTQVELVYPLAEPALESVVADRPGAVQVADGGGEQGQPGAFSGVRRAAVMVLEPVQRLALLPILSIRPDRQPGGSPRSWLTSTSLSTIWRAP